jgi:predicted ArsR family transcriptional regulator
MFDFIFPRVRKSDPLTSFEAADNAKELAKKHGRVIVVCLFQNGPMGKDGIATHTGLDGNQVARRLKELETQGWIELTGKTVASKSKRQEREWRTTLVRI